MDEICYSLTSENLDPIKISTLRELVKPYFPTEDQDDSLLFILYIFDKLQEEQTLKSSKFKSGDYDNYEDAWEGYKSKFPSITDQLFTGIYQKNIKCDGCKYITSIFEVFVHITLELETDSLEQAYQNYISYEDVCEAR